jgi:putative hydrolase of the HAD superfamily
LAVFAFNFLFPVLSHSQKQFSHPESSRIESNIDNQQLPVESEPSRIESESSPAEFQSSPVESESSRTESDSLPILPISAESLSSRTAALLRCARTPGTFSIAPLKTKIRAVTFDVGGTLMAPWPSVGHVYARVAAQLGVIAEPERLTRQFVNAWRTRGEFDYSRQAWLDLVRHSFHGMAEVTDSLFTALYNSFSTHDAWRVYEDVLPCFEALQKNNVRLAVISNWDNRLRTTLRSVGLHDHFEVITVSGEHGVNKPAREIFELTARALKLQANEILHVGDSHREDFQGARNAGFHAAHLDREAEHSDSIRTLLELANKLVSEH